MLEILKHIEGHGEHLLEPNSTVLSDVVSVSGVVSLEPLIQVLGLILGVRQGPLVPLQL